MKSWHGQSGWLRRAIVMVVLGPMSAVVNADSLSSGLPPLPVPSAWASPPLLILQGATPAPSGEPPPFQVLNLFPGELFAADNQEPALEFSVNPAEAEVLVGWRFEF